MTYPPPGGENPQYQLQPEPQQPSDPYMQGYNSTPPPGNYYQQQAPQPQYTQPPSQPMMPSQVGVQPGYPTAPGSVLPPPIPPASSGNNLGIILGVIVAIVVVLGVAAVLIIPGLTEDEDPQAGGDDPATSAEASDEEPEPEPEPETEPEPEPSEETSGTLEGWGTPINSDGAYDTSTPEGAAISYQVAQDNGDDAAMQALVSSNATDDMLWDLDWEVNDTTEPYGFLYWGVSREVGGEVQAWSGWTFDDLAPDSEDDLSTGYTYTLVEEDGQWKLYDVVYGAPD